MRLFGLDERHWRRSTTVMIEALAGRRERRPTDAADRLRRLVAAAEALAVDGRGVEDETATREVRRRVDRRADGARCHGVGPGELGRRFGGAPTADGQIKDVPRVRRRRCRRRRRRDRLGSSRRRRDPSIRRSVTARLVG